MNSSNASGVVPASVTLAAAVPPPAPTDHELMLAVRDGNTDVLGELFERHHRPLFCFLVRVTGHRATSEDLVQQVFYRILKYRHTYRGESRFSAWIYHIARTVTADHFRRRAADPLVGAPEEFDLVLDDAPHAGERAAAGDDLELMRIAFGRLAPDQREVLTLFRFQGLSQLEIARVLGCSVGAVKVRVHRALQELRERYFRLRQEKPPL